MTLPLAKPGKVSIVSGLFDSQPGHLKKRLTDHLPLRIFSSKPVLMAAISMMSMTPFAVEAWTLDFDPSSSVVREGDGSISLSINLIRESQDQYGGCSVEGTVVTGGSATLGSDYTISASQFSLGVSEGDIDSAVININIIDDVEVESNETINLSFQIEPSGCSVSPSTANITITDNDTPEPEPEPTDPTPNLTQDPSFTPNQRSIYDGLVSACENATGELLARCGEIGNADLNAVIPDEVSAQGSAAVDFGYKQFSIIHGRIVNLRNAQKQNSTLLGYSTFNINGESIPVGQVLAKALGQSHGGAAGDDPIDEPLRDSPLGFFLKGQFNVGEKDKTRNEQGFEVDRQAVTLGADYSLTDNLVLGAAFGYGATNTNYNGSNGSMETDAFEFSTYGSYFFPQDFYLDWIMSYALHNFDTKRRIQYSGLDTSAQSEVDGDQYGVSLGFGKDISIQNFIINPYARVEYITTQVDSYQETGGAGLSMEFDKQVIDSVTSTIGGQASQAISMPWGILSPGFRFEWVHQYMDDARLIQARFSQATPGTGTFVVHTDNPDRDYFNIGSSLALTLPEGRAGFLRYEYRLGQTDITDHTVELGVRIPF
ncbi:autotransporter domain-containing protein [Methylicorpusculum sp.]|uniref:autotransporter domain-containing protein n=1 Tax=Methylicorpusculum sp. TaxID=2713644 RepID=UPI0027312784|nr:autotransporter domain-containing protein [Methylicorpusculum sp.]MDP2176873.1 autotransporter domain-containing protein [Methylicorpusculum sp.]MDP3531317.1 autotransporter domain-containing protein [Methylicorpusculum sp.]MDZ4151412.1 autotransporter domain-containing protein [Methylicorpusculum sp.]